MSDKGYKVKRIVNKVYTTPGNRKVNDSHGYAGYHPVGLLDRRYGRSDTLLENYMRTFQPEPCKTCEDWSDVCGRCFRKEYCEHDPRRND